MDTVTQRHNLNLVWDRNSPVTPTSERETWLAAERLAELRQPDTFSDAPITQGNTKTCSLTANLVQNLFAHLSHEIRTPLNAILGYAEVIEAGYAGPITESQLSYLQTIRKSGVALIHELENLLDLATIESGQFPINLQVCDLYGVIMESIAINRAVAAEKDVNISISHCEFSIRADSRAFSLAMANILGAFCRNATYRSQIEIEAKWSGGLVILTVSCDGRPIAENVLTSLEEKKILVSDSSRRAKGQQLGMELELPIALGLVRLQDANLTISRQRTSGCEATISISGFAKRGF